MPYSIVNYLCRIPINPESNTISNGMEENFSHNFFKLLIILTKALRLSEHPDQFAELRFLNKNGEVIVDRKKGRNAAIKLNRILNNASVNIAEKDGKIYVTGNDGKIVGSMEINIYPQKRTLTGEDEEIKILEVKLNDF